MSNYNYEKEEKPEEILRNSAKRIERNHPLDIVYEAPIKKENKIVSFIRNKFIKIKEVKNKFDDKRIGKKEREQFTTEGYSERALKEYLDYYNDLYQEKEPDLKLFIKLVKRNGSPDLPNPYTSDSEDYFKYNIYALMGEDLEVILENIQRELKEGEILIKNDDDFYELTDNKKIITLLKSLEKNQNDENIKIKEMFKKSLQSWAIIMAYGTGCEYLKKQVHNTNIVVATIETILNVDNQEIGISLQEITDGAIKYGFINENLGRALLDQRLQMKTN